jgi:hypothetical protein
MKKSVSTLAISAVLSGLLVMVSCNAVSKDAKKSPTRLIVESVLGATDGGVTAAFLESDVQDLDYSTIPPVPYVTANTAQITLRADLIDPNPVYGPSPYNDITLTGYSVSYALPDGTGTPGVDVPLPIENSLSTIYIPVGKAVTVPFIVVLAAAKNAAPLLALAGTANSLQINALIQFTGKDPDGNDVTASGSLTITFADFYDAPPEPPASPIRR